MNTTKEYQFMALLCMTIASVFTMAGVIFCFIYLVNNGYHLWVLPLIICSILGMIGQSNMIELFGEHLKNK